MKTFAYQNIIYKFVSSFIVFPVYKFLFRGHLDGVENIPKTGSFIVVSNHGSLMDPPFLGHALGVNVAFMAKEELFKIPLLSQIIKACGAYPVRRGTADKNSIKIAIDKLLNNDVIGIFIDGTRQKDGRVNKPKQGSALLSSKTNKILVPVAIVNSHRLIRFKYFLPRFTKITIKVGEPIEPPSSSSKEDLRIVTLKLQERINNLLN